MSLLSIIRLTGLSALAVVLIALWMAIASRGFEPSPTELPGGFSGRVMAMEFVDTVESAKLILGPDQDRNRQVMHKVIGIDYIWIASYSLLFIMVGWLLCRRKCPWASYLATVAVIAGLASAIFDIRENRAILNVIDNSLVTQTMINGVRDAALIKWTLAFAAMAILAVPFYGLSRKASWVGLAFTLTAALGLAGLWHYSWIALSIFPMLAGLLILSIVAIVWPSDLKEPYC